MAIKMSELSKRSGVPKSTILYYIKEGLLPQPEKIGRNVSMYDESCVEIIKFIKFLQSAYSKSISEIKNSMCAANYDFSNGSEVYIGFLEKLSGTSANSEKHTRDELIAKAHIDEALLDLLLQKELLVPLSDEMFDEKDLETARFYAKLSSLGCETQLFEFFVVTAKELAKKMMDLKEELSQKLSAAGLHGNEASHIIFEIPISLEPYILNRHIIKENKKRCFVPQQPQ